MLAKHTILIAATIACVSAVWYVRIHNQNFKYAPAITTVIVVVAIVVYYKTQLPPTGKCVSDSGVVGSCETDQDCNAPNGQCWKNAAGQCSCVCSNGYSGPNCKTEGIPWNSPQCMGPNTQWSPRKDKNGMCVCPNNNWASGTDPKYGYVQCLKCAGNWGPLAGSSPCSSQWGQQNMLSNTCITNNNSNSAEWCNDFIPQTQNPPAGKSGNVTLLGKCAAPGDPNSCRCAQPSSRVVCQVNGWIDPTGKNQTCFDDNVPRNCSSYGCK